MQVGESFKPTRALWIEIDDPVEIFISLSLDGRDAISFEQFNTLLQPALLGSDHTFGTVRRQIETCQ
jgi:hypothetical protein